MLQLYLGHSLTVLTSALVPTNDKRHHIRYKILSSKPSDVNHQLAGFSRCSIGRKRHLPNYRVRNKPGGVASDWRRVLANTQPRRLAAHNP